MKQNAETRNSNAKNSEGPTGRGAGSVSAPPPILTPRRIRARRVALAALDGASLADIARAGGSKAKPAILRQSGRNRLHSATVQQEMRAEIERRGLTEAEAHAILGEIARTGSESGRIRALDVASRIAGWQTQARPNAAQPVDLSGVADDQLRDELLRRIKLPPMQAQEGPQAVPVEAGDGGTTR